MRLILVFIVAIFFTVSSSFSDETKNIKYRESKKIDFETLLIEGEGKRPELSVVTGQAGATDLGLLKLREDFADFITDDAGEEIE